MGTFVGKAGMPAAATASGGAGKAAKRKGPQTTPPGTKNKKIMLISVKGHRRMLTRAQIDKLDSESVS